MSYSSPEGIILGKGSTLMSTKLLINNKVVLDLQPKITYNEEQISEYASFVIECDRAQLPLLGIKDYFEIYKKK
jgi:hypothetical protein